MSALLLLGVLIACAGSQAAPRVPPPRTLLDVRALSADSMAGRDTPSRGLDQAAVFVEDRFGALGLEPVAASFRVPYALRRTVALDPVAAAVTVGARSLTVGDQVALAPAREGVQGAALAAGGRFTAAGSGLPPSVCGRVVLVEDLPREGFRLETWIWQLRKTARRAGAVGLILVLRPGTTPSLDALHTRFSAPRPADPTADLPTLPVALIEPHTAAEILADGPVTLTAPLRQVDGVMAPNVVARLRGRHRGRAVVYSAHMDHLGVAGPGHAGDSIFNGADDNASGVAVLLEVARRFATGSRPARDVVFAVVSGEEDGLIGSRELVASGVLARFDPQAAINLDMVGRAEGTPLYADVTDPGLWARIQAVNAAGPTSLVRLEDLGAAGRSDHASFQRAGIPALSLFTGFHPDYHRPTDESSRIVPASLERAAALAYRLGTALVSRPLDVSSASGCVGASASGR